MSTSVVPGDGGSADLGQNLTSIDALSLAGEAGNVLAVNGTETGFELVAQSGGPGGGSVSPSIVEGRLSNDANSPYLDELADNTLYYHSFTGNKVALYNGSEWILSNITNDRIEIAVPAANPWRIYDVFAYDDSGEVVLELEPWDASGRVSSPIVSIITGGTSEFDSYLEIQVTDPIVNGESRIGISGNSLTFEGGLSWDLNQHPWYATEDDGFTFRIEGDNDSDNRYVDWSLANPDSDGVLYIIPYVRENQLSLLDGVYVKNGDNTRRYLGSFLTNRNSRIETKVYATMQLPLYNHYNQIFQAFTYAPMLIPSGSEGSEVTTYTIPEGEEVHIYLGTLSQLDKIPFVLSPNFTEASNSRDAARQVLVSGDFTVGGDTGLRASLHLSVENNSGFPEGSGRYGYTRMNTIGGEVIYQRLTFHQAVSIGPYWWLTSIQDFGFRIKLTAPLGGGDLSFKTYTDANNYGPRMTISLMT